jgi:hypothetical protein
MDVEDLAMLKVVFGENTPGTGMGLGVVRGS